MEINASGNIIDGGYAGELSATSFSGDGSSLTNLVGLPTSLAFSSDGVLSLGRSGGQPNLTIDIDLGQTDSPSFTGLTVTNTISGNIDSADKWKTTRTLALTGAVTGSQSIDGSGNVSIATTATSDPTLTLTGDVSGSATFTNLGNASLAVTVIDDSHSHVIGNIDSFTENVQDIVGGMVSGNTETGIDVTYQDSDGTLDFVLANDPIIALTGAVTGSATMTNLGNVSIATTATSDPTLTLTGDVSGSATFTNLGNASLTVTVADDSHSHSNYATNISTNLTGTPTAPTVADSTNNTQIATTAFVKSQIGNLIDGAPTTLDTLNELAAALGDDPNHATAMTNLIGTKLDKTHDMVLTLNGDVSGAATFTDMDNATLTVTVADDSHNHLISNVDGLQSSLDSKLPSSSYTPSDILAKLTAVDGSGSTLDADLLDGQQGSYYASAASVPTNNNQLTNGAGYNNIIGTDADINLSGSDIITNLGMTDGVITSHFTKTLTLGDLGFTGATNANYITNNNQLSNGAGYATPSGIESRSSGSSITPPSGTLAWVAIFSGGGGGGGSGWRKSGGFQVQTEGFDSAGQCGFGGGLSITFGTGAGAISYSVGSGGSGGSGGGNAGGAGSTTTVAGVNATGGSGGQPGRSTTETGSMGTGNLGDGAGGAGGPNGQASDQNLGPKGHDGGNGKITFLWFS